MAFILAADGRDDDVVNAFRRYQDYLQSLRDTFAPSAFALATSEWYFNFNDHRCPHDAWLETQNRPLNQQRFTYEKLRFTSRKTTLRLSAIELLVRDHVCSYQPRDYQ